MAIRKAKVKQQVVQKLMQSAPPGETVIATIECVSGPSPWLEAVPYLRLVLIFLRRYYFLTITNSSVVVNKANMWTNRPTGVLFGQPIQTVRITQAKRGYAWSSFRYQFPNKQQPTRLNVSRYWRNELDQFMGVLMQVGVPVG